MTAHAIKQILQSHPLEDNLIQFKAVNFEFFFDEQCELQEENNIIVVRHGIYLDYVDINSIALVAVTPSKEEQ